jgi:hypothetical protein
MLFRVLPQPAGFKYDYVQVLFRKMRGNDQTNGSGSDYHNIRFAGCIAGFY